MDQDERQAFADGTDRVITMEEENDGLGVVIHAEVFDRDKRGLFIYRARNTFPERFTLPHADWCAIVEWWAINQWEATGNDENTNDSFDEGEVAEVEPKTEVPK
ncbi:MAG: hypothetical protein OES13_00250 [Acidimicrobiia bacterium]|nr:hypothetical protein [Acidimicrobiia bacterium]